MFFFKNTFEFKIIQNTDTFLQWGYVEEKYQINVVKGYFYFTL